ncbi:hypothetical protein OG594_39435 [Streptomyces sp. NBC_01214]|uniref:hypothetical protein n=1 Tax=Streptomyces sp. NBC_01214 TaxID=2903777 RepID=UPI00224FE7D3|nr:hypothetical protein [Streptomyces sp. NBC_01214]MCX4807610.1 hypothetical protein [Streptomyces sp. NBC_01214]
MRQVAIDLTASHTTTFRPPSSAGGIESPFAGKRRANRCRPEFFFLRAQPLCTDVIVTVRVAPIEVAGAGAAGLRRHS